MRQLMKGVLAVSAETFRTLSSAISSSDDKAEENKGGVSDTAKSMKARSVTLVGSSSSDDEFEAQWTAAAPVIESEDEDDRKATAAASPRLSFCLEVTRSVAQSILGRDAASSSRCEGKEETEEEEEVEEEEEWTPMSPSLSLTLTLWKSAVIHPRVKDDVALGETMDEFSVYSHSLVQLDLRKKWCILLSSGIGQRLPFFFVL